MDISSAIATDLSSSAPGSPSYVEDVEIVGHIIDSLILPKVLDEIMALGGRFEIREIRVGQRRNDPSYAQLRVIGTTPEHLEQLLTAIGRHGAVPLHQQDCRLVPADMDGAFPDGFYSTTNQDTQVRLKGTWIQVDRQEMDCGIVIDVEHMHAACIPMIEVRAGDQIVVGRASARVLPTERDTAGRDSFGFMNSNVSSEKPKGITVRDVATAIQESPRAAAENPDRRRPGRGPHGQPRLFEPPHPPRFRQRALRRQCPGNARYRAIAVLGTNLGHFHDARRLDRGGTRAPLALDQPRPPPGRDSTGRLSSNV